MRHTILLFALICCLGNTIVCGQTNERVYLQTDKQFYLSGELLWLKLYSTDMDGKLMSFSKIGYVELIRDSIPDVQVKVDIRDGAGTGWMELPVMLPTGYYRLIAYTRYMRNESANAFFEKRICIVNPFSQGELFYTEDTNTSFSLNSVETNTQNVVIEVDQSSFFLRNKGEIRLKGLPKENISLGISIAGIDPALESNTSISDWKNKLPRQSAPFSNNKFLPEYEGAIIDGVLIDLETGNPSGNSNVINLLSFPGNEIQLFAGQGDKSGNVTFYTQCTTGKQELTTTAIDPYGKKYRIDIRSPYAVHASVRLPHFSPDSTWINFLQTRNLSVQVSHAYLADSLSHIKGTGSCSYLRPFSRYILDEYTRFPNMEEVFIEFIQFARMRRTNEGRRFSMMNEGLLNYTNNVFVLFDNIPVTNHELLCSYNPLQIKNIDLHTGRYTYGGLLTDGIIAFYSYKNDYPGITFDESTQLFDYEGSQPYRYFYAPTYDETTVSSRLPDFRHTLLWEPSIQTDRQTEIVIPFTTSDLPGSYLITVEGIGADGTIVHANQLIEVKKR